MAVTIIKEDGSGLAEANSYASVADGDAYHEGHLYATAWTAATADNKAKALVMATRLVDAFMQFRGARAAEAQALQWPRVLCPDPDRQSLGGYVPSNQVPKAVADAACEMARELLVADRTAAHAGEGLKYQNTGTTQAGYDKTDTRPVLSKTAQAMLSKYGLPAGRSGMVRLVRG